jgi:2'-5' RNA ligase
LFVAVWPPAEVLDALEHLERPARPGLRWTTRDQWHVTLRFLGRVEDPESVQDALQDLGWLPATTASAGPSTAKLGASILCVPVAGLDELAVAVAEATTGQPPPEPYRGHLTLARAKRGVAIRDLAGVPFTAAWTVDQFSLVESETHPDGARYQVVAGYPLR